MLHVDQKLRILNLDYLFKYFTGKFIWRIMKIFEIRAELSMKHLPKIIIFENFSFTF